MEYARRRHDVTTSDHQLADDSGLGLLVYDPRNDSGHVLNAATRVVFLALDGATSRDDLARRVAAATGLPADPAIVDLALSDLDDAGLLAEPAPVPGGLSRRSVIARLAVGAAAVAALPLVESVARPGQAEAGKVGGLQVLPKSATTTEGVPVDVTLEAINGFFSIEVIFWLVTPPSHGTVTISGAVATYTPDEGYTGSDSFTYTAGQCVPFAEVVGPACPDGTELIPGGGALPATVSITVDPTPTPTTVSTTTTTVAPSTTGQVGGVTAQPRFTG